jgi:vitamin B12 transporter
LGAGYQLNDIWRFSATNSSGFRAPNAGEISSNSLLVPETHKSQEVGLTYSAESTLVRTTYFVSNTKNAITYGNSTYTNVGEVQNKGVELTARTILMGNSIKVNLVSQDPWNVTSNSVLARRARQYGSLRFV